MHLVQTRTTVFPLTQMNIHMDEDQADDAYSSSCGFPFESKQELMNFNLFAHSLTRLATQYDAGVNDHHNEGFFCFCVYVMNFRI